MTAEIPCWPLLKRRWTCYVIVHKHPGVDGTFPLDHVLAKPLNEQGLVLVIFEDV
jgi:hypothetical protein